MPRPENHETPAGDKQVLFFGAKDASRGETTGTYYTVGHLDANGMFVADTDTQRLDHGPDYYGANFTGSTDITTAEATITSLGWVGNWNYTADGVHAADNGSGPYLRRLGSYSLARELTLGGGQSHHPKTKNPRPEIPQCENPHRRDQRQAHLRHRKNLG